MGGTTNHSKASRVIVDNTLTASGEITINQGSNLLAASLNAGSNKIGKVDITYVSDSPITYYPLTIPANTAGGVWVQGFWNDVNQVNWITFHSKVVTAPTPNSITTDFMIEWSHDQSVTNKFESQDVYGTPSGGYVSCAMTPIFWSIASGTTGFKSQSPTLQKKARYFRIHIRNSAQSSTNTVFQFELQNLGNF